MSRATRRTITLTDLDLDTYLDTVPNVSGFIQDALRYYINNHVEVVYVKEKDFDELKKEVVILNENYIQQRKLLCDLAQLMLRK